MTCIIDVEIEDKASFTIEKLNQDTRSTGFMPKSIWSVLPIYAGCEAFFQQWGLSIANSISSHIPTHVYINDVFYTHDMYWCYWNTIWNIICNRSLIFFKPRVLHELLKLYKLKAEIF